MVAAKLANMTNSDAGKIGAAAQGKASANLQTSPVSQSDAAKLLNVSTRSVAAAAKVKDSAIPELAHAVECGDAGSVGFVGALPGTLKIFNSLNGAR